MLGALNATGKTVIVMPDVESKVLKRAGNIKGVATTLVNTLNVYDILNHDQIVITVDAVKKIEEVYA